MVSLNRKAKMMQLYIVDLLCDGGGVNQLFRYIPRTFVNGANQSRIDITSNQTLWFAKIHVPQTES